MKKSPRPQMLLLLVMLLLPPRIARCEANGNDAPAQNRPKIETLGLDEARKAIIDDRSEPYFERFADAEMKAKTALDVSDGSREERLASVKRQYQDAVREFTPAESEALQWYVEQLDKPLHADYPLLANVPWRFIKVREDLESGMPHTRGSCIVLSERILSALEAMKEKAPPNAALARMGGVLVHEKMHVLQRSDPKRFADLYVKVWGFEHVKTIDGQEKLRARWIVNPDGPDVNWVMPIVEKEKSETMYVWPLILFSNPDEPSLHGMEMSAVMLEKKSDDHYAVKLDDSGEPVIKPLLSVDGYTAKFFPSTYIYHPNEAAADLFSKVFVLDHLGGKAGLREAPDAERIENALAPIRDWFKAHLAHPKSPASP